MEQDKIYFFPNCLKSSRLEIMCYKTIHNFIIAWIIVVF